MPQKAWSNKRERQYEHIKDSAKKRGASTKRAKQIAAATVNKERARKGEATHRVALVDGGHLVRPPRRAPLRHEPAQGPHEGAALQRGEAPRDQGPLAHEQGAAPARRRSEKLIAGEEVIAAAWEAQRGPDS